MLEIEHVLGLIVAAYGRDLPITVFSTFFCLFFQLIFANFIQVGDGPWWSV